MKIVKPLVFISYSSKDSEIIDRIDRDLRAAHVEVWRDTWEMQSGDSIKDKIFKDGIPKCDMVFAYLTQNSISSPWCRLEINAGFVEESKRQGIIFAFFVDSEKTRIGLGTKIKLRVAPILNENEYQQAISQLISRAWQSLQHTGRLMDRQVSIQARITSQFGSEYSQLNVIKRVRSELILAGSNLRGWLTESKIRQRLVTLIKEKKRVRVKFLLGTYPVLRALTEDGKGEEHLQQSVRDLVEIRQKLSRAERNRVDFRFHPGVATLSAVFVNPSEEDGFVFFTPRWGVDAVPSRRLSCVIERKHNPEQFSALYDSVLNLSQPTYPNLDDMLNMQHQQSQKLAGDSESVIQSGAYV